MDFWALIAAHGASCAVAHYYGMATFFRHFSPSFARPHSLLLAAFATSSPFEMLFLAGNIQSAGGDCQRALGRLGFLLLYLGGALSSVLLAAHQRHSSNGAGGGLAAFAYHALAAPHARHALFGIQMSARMALLAQAALVSWPAFNGRAGRPGLILALNAVPIVVGAAVFGVFPPGVRH